MILTAYMVLGAAALAGAAAGATGAGEDVGAEAGPVLTRPASVETGRALDELERLASRGDWEAASGSAAGLVEARGGQLVSAGAGVWRPVAAVVQERLARWPAAGQGVFREMYESVAAAKLAGTRADDVPALEAVAAQWWLTDAGGEADRRVAGWLLRSGAPVAAARRLDRLARMHPGLRDAAELRLEAAEAWKLAGCAGQASGISSTAGAAPAQDASGTEPSAGRDGDGAGLIDWWSATLAMPALPVEAAPGGERGQLAMCPPVVAGDLVLIQDAMELFAVRLHGGEVVYRRRLEPAKEPPAEVVMGSPPLRPEAAGDRVLAVLVRQVAPPWQTPYRRRETALVGLRRSDGRTLWEVASTGLDHPPERSREPDVFDSSPVVAGDRVLVVLRRRQGLGFEECHLCAFDLHDGRRVWQTRIAGGHAGTFGQRHDTRTQPLAGDGFVWLDTGLGATACVRQSDGGIEWLLESAAAGAVTDDACAADAARPWMPVGAMRAGTGRSGEGELSVNGLRLGVVGRELVCRGGEKAIERRLEGLAEHGRDASARLDLAAWRLLHQGRTAEGCELIDAAITAAWQGGADTPAALADLRWRAIRLLHEAMIRAGRAQASTPATDPAGSEQAIAMMIALAAKVAATPVEQAACRLSAGAAYEAAGQPLPAAKWFQEVLSDDAGRGAELPEPWGDATAGEQAEAGLARLLAAHGRQIAAITEGPDGGAGLGDALRARRPAELSRVMERYPWSSSAAEAAMLMARELTASGRPDDATILLARRLRRSLHFAGGEGLTMTQAQPWNPYLQPSYIAAIADAEFAAARVADGLRWLAWGGRLFPAARLADDGNASFAEVFRRRSAEVGWPGRTRDDFEGRWEEAFSIGLAAPWALLNPRDGGAAAPLLVQQDRRLAAFSVETGEPLYADPPRLPAPVMPVGVAGNIAVLATRHQVLGARLHDGSTAWTLGHTPERLDHPLIDPSMFPALVASVGHDALVVAFFDDGRCVGLDAIDGGRLWERRLEKPLKGLAATDGLRVVYCGTGDQGTRLVSLDAISGATAGVHEFGDNRQVGWLGFAPSGDVLATGAGRLTCVSAEGARRLWEVPLIAARGTHPEVGARAVFQAGEDGTVQALHIGSGMPLWQRRLPAGDGLPVGVQAIEDRIVVVRPQAASVLDRDSGRPLHRIATPAGVGVRTVVGGDRRMVLLTASTGDAERAPLGSPALSVRVLDPFQGHWSDDGTGLALGPSADVREIDLRGQRLIVVTSAGITAYRTAGP